MSNQKGVPVRDRLTEADLREMEEFTDAATPGWVLEGSIVPSKHGMARQHRSLAARFGSVLEIIE